MDNCLFCKIINKEIPGEIVYEDEKVIAFKDINPIAPIHILIVPKQHFKSILDVENESNIVSYIHSVACKLALDLNVADKGFRLINNCGVDGGQTVMHLHYHFLAGKKLGWE